MTNRTKLYRSITGTALVLLAGLALAPTLVTAGFRTASIEPATPPATQPAPVQLAAEPIRAPLPRVQETQLPAVTAPDSAPSAPAAESQSDSGEPAEFGGQTTFASADFTRAAPSFTRTRSGSGSGPAALGAPSLGGGKNTFQPHGSGTGTGGSGGDQSTSAPDQGDAEPGDDTADEPTVPNSSEPKDQEIDQEVAANDSPTTSNGSDPSDDEPVADNNSPADDGVPPPYSGSSPSQSPTVVSVPEPSSLALLGAGILGLLLVRRRS